VASKTGLLPERDSDSIFMVVAEEGGFVGAAGIVVLYVMMSTLLLLSASGLRDRFGRLVVGGVGIYFASHLLINVSVNVGLLPMTGLTLPLFSTGGSSLLATFLALGLAVGMAAHKESLLDEDAFKSY
jgi:rod shape determining protein RodA